MSRRPVLLASFSIPGEPVSKARARFTRRGGVYTPEKTRAGEERVAWAFRAQHNAAPTDAEMAYRVEARFFSGTRQRRDVDNMLKLILDGLNGVAWVDDNQVTEIEAAKSFVPKEDAHTEVRVLEVGRLEPPKARCLHCGKEFRTYPSWSDEARRRRYCSSACTYAHRTAKRQRTCEQCGAEFMASGPSSSARYCSVRCTSDAKRKTLACDHCGRSFTKQRSQVKKANYCSPECLSTAAKKRRSSRFPGVCETCGGGVTKKKYRRCAACVRAGGGVKGKPKGAP